MRGEASPPEPDGVVSESVRYRPPAALRPYLAWCSGYRQAGLPAGRHRGLPSPYLTLIVTLDEPLTVAEHPNPVQPADRYDVLIGGLHTTPALIIHDGRQSGIQLGVTPLGARALLGLPAGELAGLDFNAADVVGRFASELHERVATAATWAGRFAVLDRLLAQRAGLDLGAGPGRRARAAGPMDMRPEVGYAWRTLLATHGGAAIADLAREAGWTSRHLGARFREETGLSPKAAARVVRFDRARRLLQRRVAAGGPPALAGLAAACGYYDQAHLAREFRDLAGCPPSQWVAEEFRNVQAGALARAEGS